MSSEKQASLPELVLLNFEHEHITGSFFDTLPQKERITPQLTDPLSRQYRELVGCSDPVVALVHYLELAELLPARIDLKEVAKQHGKHPAFNSFKTQAEKSNKYRQAGVDIIHTAYEYYQDAYFSNSGSVDIDALESLLSASEAFAVQSEALELLIRINAIANNPETHSNHPTLKEAERLLRILILNEVDELAG